MNARARKRNARGQAGEIVETEQQARDDLSTAVPRDVSIAVRQPAPWRAPSPDKPFAVECQKASGAWVLFSRYATREESHAVANRLRLVGCPTRVVVGGKSLASEVGA